jgi:DNA-binding CsgD family transcriptional regulator
MSDRLLGRERALEWIATSLDAAEAGCGGVVVIEGPPGCGKSHLLQVAVQAAQRRDFAVVSKHADETGAWSDIRELKSWLALGPHPSGSAGTGRPQLIAVDDMHIMASSPVAGDLPLNRNSAGDPLIWIMTLCSGRHNRAVRRLIAKSAVVGRIELAPLPDDTVYEMVTELLQARPTGQLRDLAADAGGNPLLVNELVEGLREENSIEIRDGVAHLVSDRIPRRIHEVVQYWLSGLSETARQFVQVAAALGRSFAIDSVARIQRETTACLLPALHEALASGVLRAVGEQTQFQHELVWRATAETIPLAVRHTLRREAAQIRVGRPDQPATEAAPECHSTDAAEDPLGPADLRELRPDGVRPEAAAADLLPALLVGRSTLAGPLPSRFADELRRTLNATLVSGAHPDEHAGDQGERQSGSGTAGFHAADLVTHRILGLFAAGEAGTRSRAKEILAEYDDIGRRRDAGADVLAAAIVLSNVEWASGDLAAGLAWGREAVRLVAGSTPPILRTYPLLALADKLADSGEFDEAEQLVGAARDEVARGDLTTHEAPLAVVHSRILMQAGRLTEARDRAQAALLLALQQGGGWVVPCAQSILSLVALRVGDMASAADHAWRCRAAAAIHGTGFLSVRCRWGDFLVSAAQLSHTRAVERLAIRHADLLTHRSVFIEDPGAAAWLVRLALSCDDLSLAASVACTAEKLAAENPEFHSITVAATHARGLIDQDVAALRRAAAEHHAPWAAALAAEDLGILLRGRSGKDSERVLHSALRRFERIGAEADCARVRARLNEEPRQRKTRAGTDEEVASDWNQLTDTERTIIRYVSEGLTNRQVARQVLLSPHTVNYHLRVVFRKLSVRSRVELARYAAYQD